MAPFLLVVLVAAPVTLVRLPTGPVPARTFVDEASLAATGVELAMQAKLIPPARAPAIGQELDAAYAELKRERGAFPTPVMGTAAKDQGAKGFDLVLIPPLGSERDDVAAVFLHGWGGNATLECWLAARGLGAEGLLTVCPSIGFEANWDSPDGRAVVRQTRALLAARGKRRLLLVGLSSGAVGAARLAARDPSAWAGLVCLEGAARLPPALPVLMVSAKADTFVSHALALQLVKGHANAELVELEGDHFAALERRDEVAERLRAFAARVLPRR
jgi:pimeloyl-ACP methyl ester carboxylesterase